MAKEFQVTLGVTIVAKDAGEAELKADALVGNMLDDYGLLGAFVDSVTDPDAPDEDDRFSDGPDLVDDDGDDAREESHG